MDILTNPLVLALLALLGVPGVTSAAAGLLKAAQDATGIPSQVFVYVASLAVTGLVLATTGVDLPAAVATDPAATVGAWIVWASANAEIARRLYETLWERLTPA